MIALLVNPWVQVQKATVTLSLLPSQVPLEEGLNKTIHYFSKELEYQANNQYIPKPKPARIKKGRTRLNWTLHKEEKLSWWFTGCNFCSPSPLCFFYKKRETPEGVSWRIKLEFPYEACFKGMDVPNNIENCKHCLALLNLSFYVQ